MKRIKIFQRIKKMNKKLRLKPKETITFSDGQTVVTLTNPSNYNNIYFEVMY